MPRGGIFYGLTALLAMAGISAWAENDRVVAVVNDQVITDSQLQSHCDLDVAIMAKELTDRQRTAVCRRTLTQLVDTELQRQYAEQRKMEPSQEEIAAARKQGAAKIEALPSHLQPVAEETLASELRWQRILASAVRPQVQVSVAEIDQLIKDMARRRVVEERELAQILLGVPTAADEQKVKQQMDEILLRLKAGEDFAALAQTYSESPESKNGGRMGWFANGELNPQLESQLDQLEPGQISGLIRTPLGWHIIKLLNVRESTPVSTEPVAQYRMIMVGAPVPVSDSAKAEAQAEALAVVAKDFKDEAAITAFLQSDAAKAWPASLNMGWVDVDKIAPQLKDQLAKLRTGELTRPAVVNGVEMVVLKAGERKVMPAALNTYRDRVHDHLFNQRMEQEARKFMRDLRQRAFVDLRG